MEPHSLVLLSGSVLDASHVHHNRPQPIPLRHGPRRPFKDIAQGFARLLDRQLKQLSRRLRRAGAPGGASGQAVGRTWSAARDCEPATSATVCSTPCPIAQPHSDTQRLPRWRAPRWRRVYRIQLQEHVPCQQDAHLPHQQQLRALNENEQQEQHLGQAPNQHQAQLQEQEQQPRKLHLLTPHPYVSSVQRRRGPMRRVGRVLRVMASRLSPQGPGEHDQNLPERFLNVATCGMFFQAGGKIVRLCRSMAARRFGWAFVAVGAIATIYHGSWGHFRSLARKVDYYAIAASSLLLRSAMVGPVPGWLTAVMLAATLFKPTLVSGSNFMAVEVRYLLLALSQRQFLAEWAAHTGISLAATACFTMEHTPLLSWFPYTHAAFHALSAGAFLTLPSALNHLTIPTPTALAA